jgi:hypothetical protein
MQQALITLLQLTHWWGVADAVGPLPQTAASRAEGVSYGQMLAAYTNICSRALLLLLQLCRITTVNRVCFTKQ